MLVVFDNLHHPDRGSRETNGSFELGDIFVSFVQVAQYDLKRTDMFRNMELDSGKAAMVDLGTILADQLCWIGNIRWKRGRFVLIFDDGIVFVILA